MTTTPHDFHCFGTPRTASLTPLQREVLQVLRDARGFFRVRGLTPADIRDRLGDDPSLQQVGVAARALIAEGLAEVAPNRTPGTVRYRLAGPGKRARAQVSRLAA